MQKTEIRTAISISTLFSLRMLGLFMVLPVFTLYAEKLNYATPFLIGAAFGTYGLTQALFQLPLGTLSDYYPRKLIIALGFGVFILGSFMCGYAHSITTLIIGRALQGMGAVGSTLTALLTDLVSPEKRSKSMAMLGIMIALSFFMAMMLGPLLKDHIGVNGIFILTGILGLFAIVVLFVAVPSSTTNITDKNLSANKLPFIKNFKNLMTHPQLLTLNIGIFCLHVILTASFIVIPLWISNWTTYLAPLIISFILTFGLIGFAEKNKKVFYLCFYAIAGLIFSELFLYFFHTQHSILFSVGLTLFLLAFNLLEATLPSLVSRLVSPQIKGSALGIYSTFQFLGIFFGGLWGGVIYQYSSSRAVLLSCALLSFLWLLLTLIIRSLRRESWQEV